MNKTLSYQEKEGKKYIKNKNRVEDLNAASIKKTDEENKCVCKPAVFHSA